MVEPVWLAQVRHFVATSKAGHDQRQHTATCRCAQGDDRQRTGFGFAIFARTAIDAALLPGQALNAEQIGPRAWLGAATIAAARRRG